MGGLQTDPAKVEAAVAALHLVASAVLLDPGTTARARLGDDLGGRGGAEAGPADEIGLEGDVWAGRAGVVLLGAGGADEGVAVGAEDEF